MIAPLEKQTGLKILHISDLHFCSPCVQSNVSGFVAEVNTKLKLDLEVHIADRRVTQALSAFVQELDPDVLVISGDVTTFGDAPSFNEAREWIVECLPRKGGMNRVVLVVPGNHDVLLAQLSQLRAASRERLPSLASLPIRWWLRKADEHLSALQAMGLPAGRSNIFANYLAFADALKAHFQVPAIMDLGLGGDSKVVLLPFASVSTDPIWMNLGTARDAEIKALNLHLADPGVAGEGRLRVLVMHHNPISSSRDTPSNLVNAYNSMPAGPQILHVLQERGIDLLLHGHQHKDAALLFDFEQGASGHAFALGVPSSSSFSDGGCNLLEVQDINHVQVTPCRFDTKNLRFQIGGARLLCLERHRPVDDKTISMRYELKRYLSDSNESDAEELWDDLLNTNAELVYISGRHLKTVTENENKTLRDLLRRSPKTYVRILLGNPDLYSRMADDLGKGSMGDLLGKSEELEELARSANRSRKSLQQLVADLAPEDRRRLDIRLAHTLLPFAATVRCPDQPWGKMVVRLLPLGALGDLRMPVLKLSQRRAGGMYDFYLVYLKYLFGKGRPAGATAWDRGDKDLKIDGLSDPIASGRFEIPKATDLA
jgi:3',5'-cyclic AMP phosphodiesterase CpdA